MTDTELWIGQFRPTCHYGQGVIEVRDFHRLITALDDLSNADRLMVTLERTQPDARGRQRWYVVIDSREAKVSDYLRICRVVRCLCPHLEDAALVIKAADESWVDVWEIDGGRLMIRREHGCSHFIDLGDFLVRESSERPDDEGLALLADTQPLHWLWADLRSALQTA